MFNALRYISLYTTMLLLCAIGTPVNAQEFSAAPAVNETLTNYQEQVKPFTFLLIKNNQTVFSKNYKDANDSETVTATTQIKIASASKWLVAATLLTLVDDKKLSLDDRVATYLPQFKGIKGSMTIRQLLSHTSGLPANSVFIKNKKLSLAQCVDSIAKNINLTAPPGSELNYGGVSFQVAARVAEIASGKDWETLFKDKIGDPCNMLTSDYGNKAYKDIGDGAYSTAEDYGKFLIMILNKGLYNDKRVLSEYAINQMMTNQVGDIPIGYTPYKLKSAQHSKHYGLGVWIDRYMADESIATEVSSQGGRGFTPWINTCKNLAGIFSTYGSVTEIQPAIDKVKEMVDAEYVDNCNDRKTTLDDHKNRNIVIQRGSSGGATYANISFDLTEDSFVSLTLFDPLGNVVKDIINGSLEKGEYNFPVDVSQIKDGVYFYKLKVNKKTETRKLTIQSNQ